MDCHSLIIIILLRRVWPFILKKLNSLYIPIKYIFCKPWLKIAQQFWRRSKNCKSLWTIGQTKDCLVFYAISAKLQPLNNSYRQWTTGDQKSSFELSAQVRKNISPLPKSILLKFQKVKLTSAMISGTFPAATASGLMRQTVTSFLPSENEWLNKKIKTLFPFKYCKLLVNNVDYQMSKIHRNLLTQISFRNGNI